MTFKPNAANATPAALQAAKIHQAIHATALAIAAQNATAPFEQETTFDIASYTKTAATAGKQTAAKAHEKAVATFLATYGNA